MSKYRELERGRWQCLVCGKIHPHAVAAIQCQHKLPDLVLYQAEQTLLKATRDRPRRTRNPLADSTATKDPWGHRYRGRIPFKRLATVYHRAMANMERLFKAEQVRDLEKMYPTITKEEFIRQCTRPPASPLQRLGLAFKFGNWNQVRAAAENLADSIRDKPAPLDLTDLDKLIDEYKK